MDRTQFHIGIVALLAFAVWLFVALPIIYAQPVGIVDWLFKDAAGFFTFCLVLVGIGQAILFYVQLRYMRDAVRDAQATARTAQAAAEAAKEQVTITKIGIFDLERAYLSVGPTKIETRFVHQVGNPVYRPSDRQEVVVRLNVHNTGRTSAFITKVYGEFSDVPPNGDQPRYLHGQEQITDLSIAANIECVLSPFDFAAPLAPRVFFWGYMEFRDIFRRQHTARFCSVIYPGDRGSPGKFQLAGNEAWRAFD